MPKKPTKAKINETLEEKVKVVSELRLTYPLMILLKVSGLAKSVYYYTLSKNDKDDKNKEFIEKIKEICFAHPTYSEGIFEALFR